MTEQEKFIKLTTFALEERLDQEVLDDLVHQLKSMEASDINNSGQTSQLSYICSCLTAKEIVAELWASRRDSVDED
jgi:hypothetical protein